MNEPCVTGHCDVIDTSIENVTMHRAGQRCFELLALIGSPQLSVEVDIAFASGS